MAEFLSLVETLYSYKRVENTAYNGFPSMTKHALATCAKKQVKSLVFEYNKAFSCHPS